MNRPDRGSDALMRPREVAELLKCSEWWVKEQARRHRVPFCWIAGSYRFTPDHVAEIIRLFEHQAGRADVIPIEARPMRRRRAPQQVTTEPAQLTARMPPRARRAQDNGDQTAA
jgi:hypothetical protein